MNIRKRLRLWSVLALAILITGAFSYWYFSKPKPQNFSLTMTAGSAVGTRHELAQALGAELKPLGIAINLKESIGSEEALDWVNSRQVDLAMVQGGLSIEDRPNVRQVIALQVEPLHLLVKKELFEKVSKDLAALDGHSIDIGEPGSGTHTLALAVLDFSGLPLRSPESPVGCIPVTTTRAQLMAANNTQDLPDAIFIVSSLPSRLVRFLVSHHGYRIVALPFGEAFALQGLDRKEAGGNKRPGAPIDKRRTFNANIPAYTYNVAPPVPEANIPSLGNHLLIVAHKDVSPEAVTRIVETVLTTEFGKQLQPPVSAKLMEMPPEYPWHAGSEKYIKANQPIVSGEVMERTQKVAAVVGAVVSGLVVLWRWYTEYARNRRSQAFRDYLNQVADIEAQALAFERSREIDTVLLPRLQERLYQLKREAIERFTEGELEGGEFMTTFLGQADHVGDLITRLFQYRFTH